MGKAILDYDAVTTNDLLRNGKKKTRTDFL